MLTDGLGVQGPESVSLVVDRGWGPLTACFLPHLDAEISLLEFFNGEFLGGFIDLRVFQFIQFDLVSNFFIPEFYFETKIDIPSIHYVLTGLQDKFEALGWHFLIHLFPLNLLLLDFVIGEWLPGIAHHLRHFGSQSLPLLCILKFSSRLSPQGI